MISVIVPIYNVEQYLRQCIDSILSQTYTDLEIILVDDGSTDGSGVIADSYNDPRIIVFHTENRGLSAARNLGIDNAHGEYLFFVDSDDWIESDTLRLAISNIGSADILCFAYNDIVLNAKCYTGYQAFEALLNEQLPIMAWGKLYRKECFITSIRFPEKRICEDIVTVSTLVFNSSFVITLKEPMYHYRIRNGSLFNTHNSQNIIDYWLAVRDRFFEYNNKVDNTVKIGLLRSCAWGIMRAWAWRNCISELKNFTLFYIELSSFTRTYFTYSIRRHFPLKIRFGVFLSRYPNMLSFWIASKIVSLTRKMQGRSMN